MLRAAVLYRYLIVSLLFRTGTLYKNSAAGISEYFGEEKIVDVNIIRIRKKIEPDPSNPKHLLTRWGFGYAWI